MSFALDSLVIFLFVLIPGITFRRFYFQGEFTKQFNSRTLAHSLTASIFPGIIIQLFTAILYKKFINDVNGVKVDEFYRKLSENSIPHNLFDIDLLFNVLIYIALMLLISWLFAQLSWRFIRVIRADRWSTIMRFKNHWNYYFKGELKGFSEFKGIIEGTLLEIRTDILIRAEDHEPRLYFGKLVKYTLNNDSHELEHLFLTKVGIYKKQDNGERVIKEVPGDLMIFNAKDIININLRYVTTPKKSFDYSSLYSLISFIIVIFILFTDYHYFKGSTIFKTFIIKLFFILYFVMISTFFSEVIKHMKTVNYAEKVKTKNSIIGVLFTIAIFTFFYWLVRFVLF